MQRQLVISPLDGTPYLFGNWPSESAGYGEVNPSPYVEKLKIVDFSTVPEMTFPSTRQGANNGAEQGVLVYDQNGTRIVAIPDPEKGNVRVLTYSGNPFDETIRWDDPPIPPLPSIEGFSGAFLTNDVWDYNLTGSASPGSLYYSPWELPSLEILQQEFGFNGNFDGKYVEFTNTGDPRNNSDRVGLVVLPPDTRGRIGGIQLDCGESVGFRYNHHTGWVCIERIGSNSGYWEAVSTLTLTWAPEGVWSTRLIFDGYAGPCMDVRNSIGDIATVGFDAYGSLDLDFDGISLGDDQCLWVTRWYDQSGNGVHLENTNSLSGYDYDTDTTIMNTPPPMIMDRGRVCMIQGSPALKFQTYQRFAGDNTGNYPNFIGDLEVGAALWLSAADTAAFKTINPVGSMVFHCRSTAGPHALLGTVTTVGGGSTGWFTLLNSDAVTFSISGVDDGTPLNIDSDDSGYTVLHTWETGGDGENRVVDVNDDTSTDVQVDDATYDGDDFLMVGNTGASISDGTTVSGSKQLWIGEIIMGNQDGDWTSPDRDTIRSSQANYWNINLD